MLFIGLVTLISNNSEYDFVANDLCSSTVEKIFITRFTFYNGTLLLSSTYIPASVVPSSRLRCVYLSDNVWSSSSLYQLINPNNTDAAARARISCTNNPIV